MTQQRGPLEYNNEILGTQFEFDTPCATFQASNYYIMRTHTMKVEH